MVLAHGPRAALAQTINVDTPVTTTGAALSYDHDSSGQDLTITTTATVTSSGNAAIVAARAGSDNIAIDVGATARGLTNGVYARSDGAGNVLVTGSGAIESTGFYNGSQAGEGIYARSGSGSVTVSGTGTTTALGKGIYALIDVGSADIQISRSGTITGGTDGIVAANSGAGGVTISGLGNVSATSGIGINATTSTGAINITTVADTTVTGATFGIYALSTPGNVTVTANGAVTSSGRAGISAYSQDGDVSIGGSGKVTSSGDHGTGWYPLSDASAIVGRTTGLGSVTIGGTGATEVTTSNGGPAIVGFIQNGNARGDVTITRSGAVTSADISVEAIHAQNNGQGNVVISGLGTVDAKAGAIYAAVDHGAIDIGGTDGLSNAIAAGGTGIYAWSQGTGTIAIKTAAGGTVTSTGDIGISTFVANGASAATTIDVGADVTGGTAGIKSTSNAGDITITTASGTTVTGKGGEGIQTYAAAGGSTKITFDGNVQGSDGYGAIWARGTTGSIAIDGAGSAGLLDNVGTGGGIVASTTTGAITLSGPGNASGTGARTVDLQITDTSATADITVTRSGTYTATNGAALYAQNSGTGSISITGIGAVTSTGSSTDTYAIMAQASGGNITVSSGSISATSDSGIYANTSGAGTVNVTVGGAVTAGGFGISAAAVDGATTITANADITSGFGYSAISAQTTGAGAITVTGSGAISGITAETNTGGITLSGTGDTSGNNGTAATLLIDGGTADIVVYRSGAFSGGIWAFNAGDGNISIHGIGAVTAGNTGIQAETLTGTVDISLTSNVSGRIGIDARGYSGVTVTTASGVTVTSTNGYAIKASSGGGGNIDIGGADGLGGAVASNRYQAIYATTTSAGTINVKTAAGGTVTSSSSGSSSIQTSAGNGATTISLGANVSGYSGVAAASSAGDITMTAAAGVSITGSGINLKPVYDGTGISVSSKAGGNIDIGGAAGLSGTVSGVGYGIYAASPYLGSTATVKVTLASGASVSSSAQDAIVTAAGGGATGITIGAGATVTGSGTNKAIGTANGAGLVIIGNAGRISGSIMGAAASGYTGMTGARTLTNTGTITLASGQSITGFTTTNDTGGWLVGTGSFGDVTAKSGSFIAPVLGADAATGTANFGSLTLQSGATLRIRALAAGTSDTIAASSLTIATGAKLAVFASPDSKSLWQTKTVYTIATSTNAVSGMFAGTDVTTDLAYLEPTAVLGSDGKSVNLTLSRGASFDSMGQTDTQKRVGSTIQQQQDSVAGKGSQFIDVLSNVSESQASGALDSLSGSTISAVHSTDLTIVSGFNGLVQNRSTSFVTSIGQNGAGGAALAYAGDDITPAAAKPFDKVRGGKPTAAEPASSWRVWASMFGAASSSSARADTGSPDVKTHDWGGAAGVEFALSPTMMAGMALGASTSPFSVGDGVTTGETTGVLLSLYGTKTFDSIYVTGTLSYGRFSTDSKRHVTVGTTSEVEKMGGAADAYSALVETGYRMPFGQLIVAPFVAMQATSINQHAAQESADTGAGLFALSYGARSTTSLPMSIGVQEEIGFDAGAWKGLATLRTAWVHEFQPDREFTAAFVTLPGSSFTASGVSASRNLARITGGLRMLNAAGTTLYANINFDTSRDQKSISGQAGVKIPC